MINFNNFFNESTIASLQTGVSLVKKGIVKNMSALLQQTIAVITSGILSLIATVWIAYRQRTEAEAPATLNKKIVQVQHSDAASEVKPVSSEIQKVDSTGVQALSPSKTTADRQQSQQPVSIDFSAAKTRPSLSHLTRNRPKIPITRNPPKIPNYKARTKKQLSSVENS